MPPKKSKVGTQAGSSQATAAFTPTKKRGPTSFGSPSSKDFRGGGPSPIKKTGNKEVRTRAEDIESFLPSHISAYVKAAEVFFFTHEIIGNRS